MAQRNAEKLLSVDTYLLHCVLSIYIIGKSVEDVLFRLEKVINIILAFLKKSFPFPKRVDTCTKGNGF